MDKADRSKTAKVERTGDSRSEVTGDRSKVERRGGRSEVGEWECGDKEEEIRQATETSLYT